MKFRLLSLLVCLMLLSACSQSPALIVSAEHQVVPTDNREITTTDVILPTVEMATPLPQWQWPRSTPEEQGMSSAVLADMLEYIRNENKPIHSLLVIRHGTLVLEVYIHPFNAQTRHGVYSVTKSVTSALVGMAMAEGSLAEVDTAVVSCFPSVVVDDPEKEKIQIKHLLTMTSGIEWTEVMYSGLNDLWGIIESDDPAQYFFNPALIEEPGTTFNYNSGGSHLLSMLVQDAVGESAEDYGADRLFGPLGITDYVWKSDFTGHAIGGTGLELLPSDMARIGLLYLREGRWQDRQILDAAWVNDSVQAQSWPAVDKGYGYQWWINPEGDYYALGWGGQQIHVFPAQDMVVVFTAGSSGVDMLHNDLINGFLLPAVVSTEPLPEDAEGQARLLSAIQKLEQPQKRTSTPVSSMAAVVDGKEWLVTGMGEWSMFTLHFPDEVEATLDLTIDGDPMPLQVGLDGFHRVTDTQELGPVAMSGYWESENTFVLYQQNLREADRRLTRIVFSGDTVKLYSEWFVEPHQEETEAVLFTH